MKVCLTCKESKPETEFARNKNTADRLQSSCKPCKRAERKAWGKRTQYISPKQSRKYYLENKGLWRKSQYKRAYGLTVEKIEVMFVSQGGKCPICEKEFQTIKTMHVDHDHITGKTRELLCQKCNTAIGLLEEDIQRFYRAVDYIEKWRELCV